MLTDTRIKFRSYNLYFYLIIFLFTFIIFKIILPYSDEPDFIYRSYDYFLNFDDIDTPESDDYNSNVLCNKKDIIGNPSDFILKISPFCNISIKNFIETTTFGLILNIFYFILIFIIFKNKNKLKIFNIEKGFTDINMHIFYCSLIYPSIIYHLGFKSNEIFLFYVVLLFFLTWKSFLLSYLLAIIALLIDGGNGFVFALFISYFYLFRYLYSIFKLKKIIFGHFLLFILLILFHEQFRILFASLLNFGSESDLVSGTGSIYLNDISTYVVEDDRLYLIPNGFKLIVTYASFIFFTPAWLKSTLLLILMSCVCFYILLVMTGIRTNEKYEKLSKSKIYDEYLCNFLANIFFITVIVLTIPPFAFIRYYIFIYPFFFGILFFIFNYRIMFLISIYGICLISIELILFRIFYFLSPETSLNLTFLFK